MSGLRITAVALVTLVCGCASSPPLRYYTLSEVAPGGTSSGPQGGADSLQVTRVTLPGELDRTQLVQRIDANRLRVAEDDRWAAPLDDMIRRVLAADLRHRAAGRSGQVAVQIESFSADAACSVELRASWAWREPGAKTSSDAQRAEIEIPSGATPCPVSAVPERMSAALARLSERMLEPVSP
jgi:uncharacterized lipoprotein YmbA